MKHPFLFGQLYGAEDDLTPKEMARVAQATADALDNIQRAAHDFGDMPWALIGGQALISYGVPRLTTDIDILALRAGDLATDLVDTFGWTPLRYDEEIGDYVIADQVISHEMDDPVLFDVGASRIMFPLHSHDGMIVELLMPQHPIEEDMIEDAIPRKIHGRRVPVAPLGGILLVKTKANRPKDIAAVEQTAEALTNAELTIALAWAKKHDPATADDINSIFMQVKERRRAIRMKPYDKRPKEPKR